MKKTRKFAAMVAALTLAACSVAPAMMFASAAGVYVDTTTGDTTNGYQADTETHVYKAYPIFTGTFDEDGLTVTGWATGYDFDGLIADTDFKALKTGTADTATVAKDMSDIKTGGGTIGPTHVAKMIEDIAQNDSGKLDTLAKILDSHKGTAAGVELSQEKDEKTTLGVGYYVIEDTYTQSTGNNEKTDAISKFILKVSDNSDEIAIIPKKSYPSVIKKVQENAKDVLTDWAGGTATALEAEVDTSNKWNDVADYNIGAAVPFKLYGSMPATLDDYDHYYYKFTDTLGSQFDQPETVTVKVGNETLTFTKQADSKYYTIDTVHQKEYKYTPTGGSTEKTLKITNTDYNCRVTYESNVLKVWFEDVKAYNGVTKDTVVTVEYTAVLNNTAVIGLNGQENKVDLTYSNSPNFEYTPHTDTPDKPDLPESPDYPDTPDIPDTPDVPDKPETPDTPDTPNTPQDKTPEDKVVVFTYEIDINKIDGTTKRALSGAEFTLKNADNEYAVVDTETGKLTGWTTISNNASKLVSGADGLFKVIGIDSGTYILTEVTPPAGGYKLPANPDFSVVLTATTVNTQKYTSSDYANAAAVLTGIAGTINSENMTVLNADTTANRGANGGVSGTIENNKGTQLPSTGGIGTALFYLAGGVMAVGAGVILVTKKRIGKED